MNGSNETTLKNFVNYCNKKKLPRALLKAIPYAGASFDELIYGKDIESLMEYFHKESTNKQIEIIEMITECMSYSPIKTQKPIHVYGSANAEHIIQPIGEIVVGEKNYVSGTELFGGGGLNYTSRLMNMGIEVLPFLVLGEDSTGGKIKKHILGITKRRNIRGKSREFIEDREFCIPNSTTSHATILVQNSQRTIMSHQAKEVHYYRQHFNKRIKLAEKLKMSEAGGVIVGHLSCAKCDCNNKSDSICTRSIIRKYSNRKYPVIVNFGKSQLCRKYEYWKEYISSDIILQFHLSEAKLFFSDILGENPPLRKILNFIKKQNITSVITLDRFGAIANYKDGSRGLVLAWPLLNNSKIIDPTGAGDAFASGMMYSLKGKTSMSFADFYDALRIGRNCAAYACTTVGGAGNCPTTKEIDQFMNTNSFASTEVVECVNRSYSDPIVSFIDMAYQ